MAFPCVLLTLTTGSNDIMTVLDSMQQKQKFLHKPLSHAQLATANMPNASHTLNTAKSTIL